jgi:hypothetical protein
MHPEERAAPLGVAGITVLINTGLFELCRIWRSVRIVTARADELSLSKRHMGRTHELGLSLQVTLVTNFYFRPPVKKWRLFTDLCELIPIGRFLHDGMAINATHAPAGMGARIPVRLDTSLMALETGFVLNFDRCWRILAEGDEPADPLTAPGRDVITARPMAVFTSSFFRFVACVEEENFSHLSLGKFRELVGVAGLADFVADVGSRRWFGRFFFGG